MKIRAAWVGVGLLAAAAPASATFFTAGNLVVAVSGNGVENAASGGYTDNQASPLSLFQYQTGGAYVNALTLPTAGAGVISAEYGSSSEGLLHRSGDGTLLSIAGYGVEAAAFNADPTRYGTTTTTTTKTAALAQSGSLAGQGYDPVARVVALVDANGQADTSTRLLGVFNGNNPRAAYTLDGKAIYLSGQGLKTDATGGTFLATVGAAGASPITGLDTSKNSAGQDTRDVQVVNGQLTVSTDSKGGSGNARDFIGTLGSAGALPTAVANGGSGPAMLPGFGNSGGTGKLTLVSAEQTNGFAAIGQEVNLSPESFFFANPTTLYVTDAGLPNNDSATKDPNGLSVGLGGLQKWIYADGRWSLAYTLAAGLGLVANSQADGTTGLFGLAGQVEGDAVALYATSYAAADTGQTYLFGITDDLSATSRPSGEVFQTLATAPVDSKFRGVAFAPVAAAAAVPEPATWALSLLGFGAIGAALRRRRGLTPSLRA